MARRILITVGDKGGEAKHQLTTEELVKHNHDISISTTKLDGYLSTENTATGNGPGHRDGGGIVQLEGNFDAYRSYGGSDKSDLMGRNLHIAASHGHSATISTAGNSQPHENRMPYIVVNRWKRTA
jgi:microcystin-dependent protein